jgi:hypothetical protein
MSAAPACFSSPAALPQPIPALPQAFDPPARPLAGACPDTSPATGPAASPAADPAARPVVAHSLTRSEVRSLAPSEARSVAHPEARSAALPISVVPIVIAVAQAVAESDRPLARARAVDGFGHYRRYTLSLLRRYLRVSMEIGRMPSLLGNVVFRGRVSSYRVKTFEDLMIFVFDVEKCLRVLDPTSQSVIAHMVLEDYSVVETASIVRESERSVHRLYGEALDRLTREFLDLGLLDHRTPESETPPDAGPFRVSDAPSAGPEEGQNSSPERGPE